MPKRSILGPLLFLICKIDLPNCLETTEDALFADDTNLSCNGKSDFHITQKLNADQENVHKLLLANKRALNKDKTKYMILGSRQRLEMFPHNNPDVTTGDQKTKQITNKKVLGIIVDDQLKRDKHIDEQCKKISKNITLLKRAEQYVPEKSSQCIIH